MLEYLSPAHPPALCDIYPEELQRYYGTTNLALYRAALPYRQLQAANQGCFGVVRGSVLSYLSYPGVKDHALPFTPVSIGLDTDRCAWLLDASGGLWRYHPDKSTIDLVWSEGVLALAPDAQSFVSQEGQAYAVVNGSPQKCADRVVVGTRNWGNVPSFCDVEGQWYLGVDMLPFAREERQTLHADGTIHYLSSDGSLRWIHSNPAPSCHILGRSMRQVIGSNGSVVAETTDHNYHFFMATGELPYRYLPNGQLTEVA